MFKTRYNPFTKLYELLEVKHNRVIVLAEYGDMSNAEKTVKVIDKLMS